MMHSQSTALEQYHAAYNDYAYQETCNLVAWVLMVGTATTSVYDVTQTPAYIKAANLLTDTALEICGHPGYGSPGWKLAHHLQQICTERLTQQTIDVTTVQRLFSSVDAYLQHYHQHMQKFRESLDANPQEKASYQLSTALHLSEEAIWAASTIPTWQGRTMYHLISSSAGLCRMATAVSQSPLTYAAEKLQRSLRDLLYGLNEMQQHTQLPDQIAQARATLHHHLKEK